MVGPGRVDGTPGQDPPCPCFRSPPRPYHVNDNGNDRLPRRVPTPESSIGGRSFFDSRIYEFTVQFGLYPNEIPRSSSDVPKIEGQPWVAHINIKCEDVPWLMREGFHWSEENNLPEEGYMRRDRKRSAVWWKRDFFLIDLHEPRRWEARIVVEAGTVETLRYFRLTYLTEDIVRSAKAWTRVWNEGDEVMLYNWQQWKPETRFNAVYSDTPLGKWWPWPKENVMHSCSVTQSHQCRPTHRSKLEIWFRDPVLTDQTGLHHTPRRNNYTLGGLDRTWIRGSIDKDDDENNNNNNNDKIGTNNTNNHNHNNNEEENVTVLP
ncbi:hypothetical protein F4777DRAFT_575385 [Nemania sp. FL0916]|nr:hypothetical protein F4777DRAFT_575385 [Nemania sp. FL0916]